MRARALHHPVRSQRANRRAGVIGQYTRISRRPPAAELRPIEQGGVNDRRTYGAYNFRDVVDLGKVLTDEENKRNAVAEFEELDRTARDLHGFPPTNVGMKRASKVILINLILVEGPSMVLILTVMKPLFFRSRSQSCAFFHYRVHAHVHPVAGKLPRL